MGMVIRVRLGLGVGVVMTGILLSDSLDPWLTLTLLSVFDIPRNTAIKSEKLKSLQAILEDQLIEIVKTKTRLQSSVLNS